jgi:hypothetical protein
MTALISFTAASCVSASSERTGTFSCVLDKVRVVGGGGGVGGCWTRREWLVEEEVAVVVGGGGSGGGGGGGGVRDNDFEYGVAGGSGAVGGDENESVGMSERVKVE